MKIFFNNNLFQLTFWIVRIGKNFSLYGNASENLRENFRRRFKIFKELFLL